MILPKKFAAKARFGLGTFKPPIQYDLQLSAEKHNHITHAAVTTTNLEAATPLRYANNELHNAIELRTQASQVAAICSSKPDLDVETEKRRF